MFWAAHARARYRSNNLSISRESRLPKRLLGTLQTQRRAAPGADLEQQDRIRTREHEGEEGATRPGGATDGASAAPATVQPARIQEPHAAAAAAAAVVAAVVGTAAATAVVTVAGGSTCRCAVELAIALAENL